MTYHKIKEGTLTGIAEAIRGMNGTSDAYNPTQMAQAVNRILAGGAGLNIAYGDTPPEDTTKLWVKTEGAERVYVKTDAVQGHRPIEKVGAVPQIAMTICAVAVGTKVYLFGGVCGSNFQYYLDTINVFDTQTNTISTLDVKLPVGARNIQATAVGTKIYLFGGYGGSYLSSICVFDTETNTISTLNTKLPTAAMSIGVATVDTKVYLFGGRYGDANNESGDWLDTIHVFDPATNTISTSDACLPTRGGPYYTAAVGTKIYLFNTYNLYDYSTISIFDTETSTISTLDFTVPRSDGSVAVGTKIYLLYRNTDIREFDTESGTVTLLDVALPLDVSGAGNAAVGTKVYRFGGYGSGLKNGIYMLDTVPVILLTAGDLLVEADIANIYLGDSEDCGEKVAAAVYKDGAWVEI